MSYYTPMSPLFALTETLQIQTSPLVEWVIILAVGLLISFFLYFIIGRILRKTGIEQFLNRFLGDSIRIWSDPIPKAVGKYIAVFVLLLFLRSAVEHAGYTEIEQFLTRVVGYLPHLLLALLIAFFGFQSSKTGYSIVYNAVNFENPRTAVVIANMARIIIIFFTFTIVLDQINAQDVQIIPEYLIKSILIGFVAAASLAFGLAFGLGGRESAAQIIHEYLNKKNGDDKNLKN